MLISRQSIRVAWGDCDPAGIVYFPRYLEYFDACTVSLFEHAGLRKHEMLNEYGIAGIPLVDVRARFIIPSTFGDDVTVESSIIKWGTSSFVVQHRLMKGTLLAVEAFETRVWVTEKGNHSGTFEAQPVPDAVKRRFELPQDSEP